MLRQTPPSSASSAEALGESTATPTENNNSPFVTLTESGSKLESLQTPGGTDVSVSAKLKKPSPPAPPPSRTSRKHPNKLQKFNLIPRPALPIPPPSGPNYKPAISSPLREIGEDGSSDVAEDEPPRPLSRAQRQRSLKIRVAVSTTQNRRLSNTPEPETNYWYDDPFANVGPQEPTRQRGSPAATMDTIGQYFSRYPSRRPSINPFGDTISVASEIPYAEPTSITEDPIGLPTPGTFEFGINDPERGFLPSSHRQPNLYPAWDEKEDDDDLHNPDGTDDQPPRLRDYCLHWNPRRCGRIFCGGLVVAGILAVFIVWPIVSGVRVSNGGIITERISPVDYGILGSIRTIMVDPDTPDYAMTRNSVLGRGELKLVFSDEFSQEGRTFYPGEDQFWEAVDLHYAATNDLEWYDPDAITTADGALQIRLDAHRNHDLDYRSGMLQSWNKLCFKGGVMEVSASLAGPGGAPGLWPGIWTLGNLARPGYRASTDGLWPYSYNKCDVGITPNQSSPDGISFLPGQRLAKCTCEGEDHPSPGIGRGAPEIDSLEGSVDYGMRVGVATQSSQIAPFDIWYQPDYDFVAIKNLSITQMNGWRGGPFQQALSSVTTLNNDWYDGIQYQKYAFEYIPGEADGSIAWFVGDEETIRMTGNAIGPNGNIGQRDISQEPMSMILNLGFSTAWAWIDYDVLAPRLMEGTIMRIDYVRIYQEEGKESITCDPPGYPTTTYIRDHPRAYNNPNITIWDGINAANNPALLITVADSSARHGVLMAKEFLHGPVYMNS